MQQSEISPLDLLYNSGNGIEDITAVSDTQTLAGFIFNIIQGVGVAVILFFLGVALINIIQSGNNPENVKKARNGLIWAIIGLVIVLFSWSIRVALINTIGFEGLSF